MSNESLQGTRWIGRVLRDRWRIDARISRGGVGTVYAATHKNNGSRAAIKVLHPEFSRDADTRSRFLQEGYAANHVNHPGVVRILDDDTTDEGYAYLVMELLEGELLETRRVRKGGKLPLPDVFEVAEQLLDVLAAAHEKGIVHRDIKPDNLFITQERRLKVLDFGFAQMRSQFRPDVTATGFVLGTPGFMSPEQAVGNRAQVDAQTDVWAAGATLFTLISGVPVHDGQSAAEMLVAAANFQPRSLAAVTTGIAPEVVDVVDRAIAFDKDDRWPNARSMQLALRGLSSKRRGGAARSSIPDAGPASGGPSPHEDRMLIEELDPSELVDSGSAHARVAVEHGKERGGPARSGAPPRPTGPPRPAPRPAQPALQRPPTPRPLPAQTLEARGEAVSRSHDEGEPQTRHTAETSLQKAKPTAPVPRGPDHAPKVPPLPVVAPHAVIAPPPRFGMPTPQHFAPTEPPRASADELAYIPPRKGPPARRGTSRALLFVGITAVTMIVVILAGLLVLHFAE